MRLLQTRQSFQGRGEVPGLYKFISTAIDFLGGFRDASPTLCRIAAGPRTQ